MSKTKHINADNYLRELKRVCKHFDDLCPGCRLRLLSLVTAHYINGVDEKERVGYMMNYMHGLNTALECISIVDANIDSDTEKKTLQ